MLKKEHLNYSRRGNLLKPRFLGESTAAVDLAERVIKLCRSAAAEKMRRNDFDELKDAFIRSTEDMVLTAGLFRVMEKKLKFSGSAAAEHTQWRRSVLLQSAILLADFDGTIEQFQSHLPLSKRLYGDLAEFDTATDCSEITPKILIENYNLGLAQTFLCFAEKLTISCNSPTADQLRKVAKYLKFFRLLAEIKVEHKRAESTTAVIEISGPLSLFGESRKYGLLLSGFFPAALKLPEWKLTANVVVSGRDGVLKLNAAEHHLVSPYNHYSNYIPEEIKMFYHHFKENNAEFSIVRSNDYLLIPGGELIFPDFSFCEHATGKVFHLELIHRFHVSILGKRMEQIKRHALKGNYLIGIDRAVVVRGGSLAEEDGVKSGHVFYFTAFPGVAKVSVALKLLSSKDLH